MSEQPSSADSPQTSAEAFQDVLDGRSSRATEETVVAEPVAEPAAEEEITEQKVVEETVADDTTQEHQDDTTAQEEDTTAEEEELAAGTYRLPLGDDGELIDLTQDELQNHLLRQQDYTRKTQAIADERRALTSERDSIRAIRETQATLESELGALREADPVEPDQTYWDQLKTDNPMQWMIERQEWTERKLQREQTDKRYADLQQQMQNQQQLEMQQKLADEHLKLVERVPAWADEKVAQTERAAIRSYGLQMGFSDEELSQVFDHRAVEILLKAMRYDTLQQRRGEMKTKALKKPMSAGAAALQAGGTRQHSDFTKAKQRLAKTNSREDARAAFQALLQT